MWGALKEFRLLAVLQAEKVEYDDVLDAAYTARREQAVDSLRARHGDRGQFSDEEVEAEAEEMEKAGEDFSP